MKGILYGIFVLAFTQIDFAQLKDYQTVMVAMAIFISAFGLLSKTE